MSPQLLRTIISLALIVHGIGHIMGILPAIGVASTESWHYRSWLLTNAIGDSASKILGIVIWTVATIGFIAAGAGALGWSATAGYWRAITVICSIVSLVGLFLFWNAFVMLFPNKIGAIAVNVVALVGILFANWPSTDIIP